MTICKKPAVRIIGETSRKNEDHATGALITAAGMSSRMKNFKPLMKIGAMTVIERVIITLLQSGAAPVVVVTGNQADTLERYISGYPVTCLRNPGYYNTQMLDSAKIGMEYLLEFCDRILFTPADVPLFTVSTVRQVIETRAALVIPLCEGQEGHPLAMERSIMEYVLTYKGERGIRGALNSCGEEITYINVSDYGTLLDVDTPDDFEILLKYYNRRNECANASWQKGG